MVNFTRPIVAFTDELEFQYDQRSGCFYLADRQDGLTLIGRGYSGKGVGLNEPSFEDRVAEGPIPRGLWRVASSVTHQRLGPVCFPLAYGESGEEEIPHNRSGFYIHGDNSRADFSASSGCIILPRSARDFIGGLQRSGVRTLRVV